MLEVKALNVAAGGFRLRNIDLVVAEGECHAVLGPSGAGKSTLLSAVLGMLPPQGGSIHLNGDDITNRPIESRDWATFHSKSDCFRTSPCGTISPTAPERAACLQPNISLLWINWSKPQASAICWRAIRTRSRAASARGLPLYAPWPASLGWYCWMNHSLR